MKTFFIAAFSALLALVVFSVVTSNQTSLDLDAFKEEFSAAVDNALNLIQEKATQAKDAVLGGVTRYDRVGYGEGNDKLTHGVFTGILRASDGEGQEGIINNTGGMLFIKNVSLFTNNSASSSFRFYVGTSTAETVSQVQSGAMNQLPTLASFSRTLLNGWYIATGTSATSTDAHFMLHSSDKVTVNALYGTSTAAGDEGGELLNPFIRAGEYINVLIKEASQAAEFSADPCGEECETATSTARGFDLYYQIEWTATSTPTDG